MLTIMIVLAVTGCRKEQHDEVKSNLNDENAFGHSEQTGSAFNLSACAQAIPDSLKVPEGNRLVLQAFARGVQIYQVQRSAADPTVFLWVNTAPSATLYGNENFTNEVAIHFAGPTWQFTKGPAKDEKVVAKKEKGVTVDATAIQWLLLKAVPSLSSPGNKITYIQRLYTHAGLAPTTGADEAHLGQVINVPYTATYLFYMANN